MRRRAVLGATILAAGAYALCEPLLLRLRTYEIDLPPGTPSLDVLHLADSHLTQRDRSLTAFLGSLPSRLEREPDLILMTGDMIDDDSGITPLLDALSGMEARLGKFYVFGSHDYLHGSFRLPTKYLTGRKTSPGIEPVDTDRMVQGLEAQGWKSLMNTTVLIEDEGHTIRLSGVDDPYMDRHRTEHIARAAHDIVAIGLTHAPDVVSEWFLTGFDLVLAGHTHGGQVRFPLIGALVTNSSLPAALAAGLHEVGSGRLHVSPGLGASRYTPIRFLCRPEATLLRLRPGSRPKR